MFPFQPPSTPLQNNISPSQTRLSERVYYIECKLTNCLESAIFHRTCGLGKRNASNVDFSLRKMFLLQKKKIVTISSELKIKRKKKKSQIQVQFYYIAASFQWKNDENYPFFTSQLVELYTILLAQREQLTPQIAQKKNGRSRPAVPEKRPEKCQVSCAVEVASTFFFVLQFT